MKRPRQRAPRDRDGKPVYFADEPYDLRLLAVDNGESVPLDPDNCAYVCAWRRLGHRAKVYRHYSFIDFGPFIVKYRTTPTMQRQLTANDQGGRIFPGDYRLGPIPPSGRKPREHGVHRGAGGGNPPRHGARPGPGAPTGGGMTGATHPTGAPGYRDTGGTRVPPPTRGAPGVPGVPGVPGRLEAGTVAIDSSPCRPFELLIEELAERTGRLWIVTRVHPSHHGCKPGLKPGPKRPKINIDESSRNTHRAIAPAGHA